MLFLKLGEKKLFNHLNHASLKSVVDLTLDFRVVIKLRL